MWKCFSVRLGHRFYWFYHLLTDENSYSTCKASSTFKYRKQGNKTLLFVENLLYPGKEQHLPMITLCDNTMRGDLVNNRLSMSVRTEFSQCIMSFSYIYLPPCLLAFGESWFYKHKIYTQTHTKEFSYLIILDHPETKDLRPTF